MALVIAWDDNGNLLSETTGTAVQSYTWDKDNRLRQVTQPSGVIHQYQYDANGLRTRKTEAGVETRFLLDGPSVLAELDATNAATVRYLLNPEAIDDIYAFETLGSQYFPLTDALGSIVAITDSTGAVVRRNDYEVFGARTTSGTGPALAFGFTGREHDAPGGIYYRNRIVLPREGRFLSADRAGMIDGPNLYTYAKIMPTMLVDPAGRTVHLPQPMTRVFHDALVTMLASKTARDTYGRMEGSSVNFVFHEYVDPGPTGGVTEADERTNTVDISLNERESLSRPRWFDLAHELGHAAKFTNGWGVSCEPRADRPEQAARWPEIRRLLGDRRAYSGEEWAAWEYAARVGQEIPFSMRWEFAPVSLADFVTE